MVLLLRTENFFRTTRELEFFFFVAQSAIFSPRIQHEDMTKTLNQIFFSSNRIRIFFSAALGIRIFFLEKTHNPPPVVPLVDFKVIFLQGLVTLVYLVILFRILSFLTHKDLNYLVFKYFGLDLMNVTIDTHPAH
jgi:hypothetical protein